MRKNGFTLSEVLITLGVIGVVAAITIPSLISEHKRKETATRLKATYSTIAQALKAAEAEHGEAINWTFENAEDGLNKYFFPYFEVLNKVENFKYVADSDLYAVELKSPKYRLKNGSMLLCNWGTSSNKNYYRFYVDTNGTKGPNSWGNDLFYFYLEVDENGSRLVPCGYKLELEEFATDRYDGCMKENGTNWGCAALIMKQGWEITKDYPRKL